MIYKEPNQLSNKFSEYSSEVLGVRIPSFPIEKIWLDEVGASEETSNSEFLELLARQGLKSKGLNGKKEYEDRLRYELDTLRELEFVDYILLVWYVCKYCRENDIPIGLGRGSAAGSLICFIIGITGIDPIKYGLYFERFISKTRAKKNTVDGVTYLDGKLMCDIDLDICYYKRQQLIDFLSDRFKGKSSKIGTFTTLSPKLLIKECGKIVGGKTEQEMNDISSLVPSIHGKLRPLKECYEGNKEKEIDPIPEFKRWVENNKYIYETALKLEGMVKNRGSHASALALSFSNTEDSFPIELTHDNQLISSYDMDDILLFNVKLDLLGLRTITLCNEASKQIGIKVEDINVNDPFIYQQLQDLKYPYGLFQVETPTGFRVIKSVKPRNIEHLTACLSLARPGAIDFVGDYAKFVETGTSQSIHPDLDKVLEGSGGLCLYQESLMRIVHEVFNLSLLDAETARRGAGKKKLEVVNEIKEKLLKQTNELGLDKELFDKFWKILQDSADYSFNKCLDPHSTFVVTKSGNPVPLCEVNIGDQVLSYDIKNNTNYFVEVLKIHKNETRIYHVLFKNQIQLDCSINHKILTKNWGMQPLHKIMLHNYSVVCFGRATKIERVTIGTIIDTLDLEVNHPDHNFYANDIVVSNSHAASYANITAITTYLKFKHPKEFFLSLLKMAKHEQNVLENVATIQREMRNFNMKLLPPHIINSDIDFKIEQDAIRFGLSSIKGLNNKTLENLDNFKGMYDNQFDIFEAAKQAGLNIGALSALIQAGAMDDMVEDKSRTKTVFDAQLWNSLTDREKKVARDFGKDYNWKLNLIIKDLNVKVDPTNKKGNKYIKDSRYETLKRNCQSYIDIYLQNSKNEKFANWYYETVLLGYSPSHLLKEIFVDQNEDIMSIGEVLAKPIMEGKGRAVDAQNEVVFAAMVKDAYSGKSKAKKTPYVRFSLADETGEIKAMIFGGTNDWNPIDKMERCKTMNNGVPRKESIVVVKGIKKDKDMVFAELVTVQDQKIFVKMADFARDKKKLEEEE